MAISYNNLALEESSTITAKVASVVIPRGSTNEHQEILVVGDPESSLAIARVVDVEPPSTSFGQVVRLASTGVRVINSSAADLAATVSPAAGSTWAVRPLQSSQADLRATIYQSTAADLLATVSPSAGSTWSVRPLQSSQADLRATIYQSTAADLLATVRVNTSSGGAVEGSTTAPAATALGLHVRQVLPTRNSTRILVNIQTASGSTTLVSSQAGLRHRVSAFSVTSTVVAFSSCAFLSSGASERWGFVLGSGSSGITGANLAVMQPGSIFETDAGEALGFSASSSGLYSVAISYFTEA